MVNDWRYSYSPQAKYNRYNFGFIYKKAIDGSAFYDWNEENAKFCIDPQLAIDWYGDFDYWETFNYDNWLDPIEISVPAITETDWYEDITSEFRKRLYLQVKDWKVSDEIKNWLISFLKEFDIYGRSGIPIFKKKQRTERIIDDWLLAMKLFMSWLYRFDEISYYKREGWSKTKHIEKTRIWEDYTSIAYKYNGWTFTTPLYWSYAPRFVQSLFGWFHDDPNEQKLERWQREFLLDYGRENYLMMTRWWWKSLICTLLAELFTLWQDHSNKLSHRKVIYVGPTEESIVNSIFPYISNSIQSYWQYYLEFVESKKSLYFKTVVMWKEIIVWELVFVSADSKSIRGMRPFAAIIDEAAICNRAAYDALKGNLIADGTLLFCISTVDSSTQKNWFYQQATFAELRQFDYEQNEDLIVRLWRKYWLDKKTKEQVESSLRELEQLREEYFNARPFVCKRYTIYDSESQIKRFWLDNIKKNIQDARRQRWDAYVLAEFFSTLMDKQKTLDVAGAFDDIPDKFDDILIYLDRATESDDPWVCILWILWDRIYVIDSFTANTDRKWQISQIKQLKEIWHDRLIDYDNEVYVWADITSDKSWIDNAESQRLTIDFPMYSLPTDTQKEYRDSWVFYIAPKKVLKYNQEAFEWFYVRINRELATKTSWQEQTTLLYEIENLQLKEQKNGYKRLVWVWKDDKAFAMMFWVYIMYVLFGTRWDILSRETTSQRKPTLAEMNTVEFLMKMHENKMKEKTTKLPWNANRY